MDDTEDDARYPPIPYHPNRRRPPPPSRRIPPPSARTFPTAAGDDFAAAAEDLDDVDPDPTLDDDDEEHDPYARRRTRPADDNDSSSDSRGKRRRLDKYALGFEFAPRAAAAAAAKPPPPLLPPVPPVRNSPGDWTEEATFVLLDAWGELYLQNGRKSIRSDEWSEVAKKVREASKILRSDAQCRNRLDTLKKKFRKEKAKIAEGFTPDSKWPYFAKMDFLMQSSTPPPLSVPRQHHHQPPPPRMQYPVDAGDYAYANSRTYTKRPNGMDEMRDSPGDTGSEDYDDEDDDGSDMPPPRRERFAGGSESSFRMLANSIQKFGEMYEKIEHSKRQQMAELERMRKEFHRDLEAQKRQILERAQVQIAQILEEEAEEDQEEERSQEEEDNDDGVDVST